MHNRKVLFICLGLGLLSRVRSEECAVVVRKALTIVRPGRYVLADNLTVGGNNRPLVIESAGVTLDLNGFTVSNISDDEPTIRVRLVGTKERLGVEIGNGRLQGGNHGVHATGDPDTASLSLKLDRVEITKVREDGVHIVSPANLEITHSFFRDIGDDALHVAQGTLPLPFNVKVAENSFTEIWGCAVHVESPPPRGMFSDNIMTRVALNNEDQAAVMVVGKSNQNAEKAAFSMERNVISEGGANAAGIVIDIAANGIPLELRNNSISRFARHGIEIRAGEATIAGNSITSNNGSGVDIAGSFCLIEGNRISRNQDVGIRFENDAGHAYRNNYLRGNTQPTAGGGANSDAGGNIE